MSTQFACDLRLARRKAGYTQTDIAHLLGEQQSVISELEHGALRPNLAQIISLSIIYGRSFEDYFGEIFDECRNRLAERINGLPAQVRRTAHTFNRDSSLQRLHADLATTEGHGGA
jgi:transcriptional regulator with XRE-family HTH domain